MSQLLKKIDWQCQIMKKANWQNKLINEESQWGMLIYKESWLILGFVVVQTDNASC